jgi:hypothetical protein
MPRLLLRRLEGVRSGTGWPYGCRKLNEPRNVSPGCYGRRGEEAKSEDEELQKREGVEVETGQHSSFGD